MNPQRVSPVLAWIAVIGLALFALALLARGQDLQHDGAWWRTQPNEFKRAYLLGALDHAAPSMNPTDGLEAQYVGPEVGKLVELFDSFYAIEENRPITVQAALPVMLIWLDAGPRTSWQEALARFDYSAP